jgi:hypothetical protein
MRIYEIVSNQNITNKQILTEIDWKKIRNALIGGAMSLAVLGAPGQAIAQSLDTNKITPDQAIELVKKKIASGEIRPDQLQNLDKSVQKTNTSGQFTKDPIIGPSTSIGDMSNYKIDDLTKKTFSLATTDGRRIYINDKAHPYHNAWHVWYSSGGSGDPNVQTVQGKDDAKFAAWYFNTPEYGKDFPRWSMDKSQANKSADVKKDEPKKAEPTVKQDYSADLSIKGVKFGMTKQELRDLILNTDNVKSNVFSNLMSDTTRRVSVNFTSLLGVSDGLGELNAILEFDEDERLVLISFYLKTEVMLKLVNAMSDKFGSPDQLQDVQWQNKAGAIFPNKNFRWNNVKGAKIVGSFRGNERDYGLMAISSIKVVQKAMDIGQSKKTKDQADF